MQIRGSSAFGALESASTQIVQRHGVTQAPGLYVLGLRFQRRRASHIIGGVGEDAALLAGHIAGRAPAPARRRGWTLTPREALS